MLQGTVLIEEREKSDNSRYTSINLETEFVEVFGEEAMQIALTAISTVLEKYPVNTYYLHRFKYVDYDREIKFWLLNEINRYRFVLAPDDEE